MTNVDVADLVRLLEQKVDVILEMLGVDSNILPQPNTKEEWKEFGIMWLDGRGNELQWMDTSEHEEIRMVTELVKSR